MFLAALDHAIKLPPDQAIAANSIRNSMTTREDKKQWEIRQGFLVAKTLNETEGSDYEAGPAKQEPADVILKSSSGKYPDREAQIVSIPLDFRSRDDKGTIEKLRTSLRTCLKTKYTSCSGGGRLRHGSWFRLRRVGVHSLWQVCVTRRARRRCVQRSIALARPRRCGAGCA